MLKIQESLPSLKNKVEKIFNKLTKDPDIDLTEVEYTDDVLLQLQMNDKLQDKFDLIDDEEDEKEKQEIEMAEMKERKKTEEKNFL